MRQVNNKVRQCEKSLKITKQIKNFQQKQKRVYSWNYLRLLGVGGDRDSTTQVDLKIKKQKHLYEREREKKPESIKNSVRVWSVSINQWK